MDTLIIWVYILKRFQSKERHNFICYLKKLKYNAFPLKFPICSFVAQLDQIIRVSFSRQRQTVLCSYRTKAPIQNWNSWKSSSTTTSKFHVKFFVNYLKPLIISLPWQGKPKRERHSMNEATLNSGCVKILAILHWTVSKAKGSLLQRCINILSISPLSFH